MNKNSKHANSPTHAFDGAQDKVRADKWLWAARFFRTRSLAKDAIDGGKVHMNGSKIKTSKELRVGDTLTIRQGHATRQEEKTVIITALSDVRGNATAAQALYQETEASLIQREFFAEQRKLANLARPDSKPNKKERRELNKFKNQW
ncbi:RNA-binding protein [Moraxella caviae]|uniref:Heat shock protein 15 n=1 Tax=Moraxella caviae TaxID=34060 RepID=A0A1S9ZU27_9GAMM|nr:S4 domain-containing protein [Moraxella caviae]OOR87015.1 RNA-binding protein [Moraxella caviae]STZ10025.1 Heat shock protein 15 [Moraxella caviae]VEW13216.1 Heat shock protein 15 [Moraxella caviae]